MCELAGRPEVPVHAGRMKPLAREAIDAAYIHGETGLDGVELPEPSRPLAEQHAVAYVIDSAPDPHPASLDLRQGDLAPLPFVQPHTSRRTRRTVPCSWPSISWEFSPSSP